MITAVHIGPPYFLIDRGVAGYVESVYRPAGPWECALTGAREMISDLNLWRAAQVMIKRYGDGAASEAAMRAPQ